MITYLWLLLLGSRYQRVPEAYSLSVGRRRVSQLLGSMCAHATCIAVMAAIDRASKATLRHELFAAMRFRPAVDEAERVYSSHPDAYPTGGRKKKLETSWARDVLLGRPLER